MLQIRQKGIFCATRIYSLTYFNHENKLCSEFNARENPTEAPAKNQKVKMRLTKSKYTFFNSLGFVGVQQKGWTSSFKQLGSERGGGGGGGGGVTVTPDISLGFFNSICLVSHPYKLLQMLNLCRRNRAPVLLSDVRAAQTTRNGRFSSQEGGGAEKKYNSSSCHKVAVTQQGKH